MKLILTGILALLVVGCASDVSIARTPPANGTAQPIVASPAPQATAMPPPTGSGTPASAVWLNYVRSGGFAGFNDHLSVDANGHATLARRTGKTEFDLSQDQIGQVQTAFQAAGFSTIGENSMPKAVPPDAFSYSITYAGHQVRTADSAVPEKLQPILQMLNRIVDSNGK